jgi:hypothetical protein
MDSDNLEVSDMRTITTRNSVYEVSEYEKLIRRTTGLNPPTPHVGEDGIWQSYLSIMVSPRGLLIRWPGRRETYTTGVVSDEQES